MSFSSKAADMSFMSRVFSRTWSVALWTTGFVWFFGLFFLPGIFLFEAGSQNAVAESTVSHRIIAVATTGMVADMVRAVGGENVEVAQLMASGVDPHLFKPGRHDMLALIKADVIFYNGLLLEGRMTDALARLGDAGRHVVAVSSNIPQDMLFVKPGGATSLQEGHPDPHVWMDPGLWALGVDCVADALCDEDETSCAVFRQRAAVYRGEIESLVSYGNERLTAIPPSKRVLITSHDAFRYFGRRFDLEVVGIQGISTESEAGLREIEELVRLIVGRGVEAVFTESTISPRNIAALRAGVTARGNAVADGGELFADAMGAPGTAEGTYPGMIRHNIETVRAALLGTDNVHKQNVEASKDENTE
ncbi:MAG: zinc ABC transporter substrate-binding protein [bacterium]|nr:zinc ABC transporter substrate-binding protein [bacterium]